MRLLCVLLALTALSSCGATGTMPSDVDRPFIRLEKGPSPAMVDEVATAMLEPTVKEVLTDLAGAVATLNTSFRFPTRQHFEVYRLLAENDRRLREYVNVLRHADGLSPLDPCTCVDDMAPTGGCRPDMYWVVRHDFPCSDALCSCYRRRVPLYVSETPLSYCGGKLGY